MKTGCCNTGNGYSVGGKIICLNTECDNYLGETSLTYEFHKWKKPVSKALLLFFIVFSFEDFSMESHESDTALLNDSGNLATLNIINVEKELEDQQIVCPRVVLAQIKVESGNLSSKLLKRTNNMLGMRYPFKRETKACGLYIPSRDTVIFGSREELRKYSKTMNYAVYKTWQEGIADYKLWQDNCFKVSDKYLSFLGNVYAEDSLYVHKLRKVAGMAAHN